MRISLQATLVLVLAVAACTPAARQPDASATSASAAAPEAQRLRTRAGNVTITRDDWGIAHVRGRTDADAVFGMIYAQAEDDFNRIETNYLNSLGRLAEAEGESAIWSDLRQRLFIDADSLRARYALSPAWLRTLMDAWADGLNHYLATHPETRPRVITRFEPWMALSFSEGSIGGDIESISLAALQAFYGGRSHGERRGGASDDASGNASRRVATADRRTPAADSGIPREPGGSNGIAIAPSNTAVDDALLLINPHTSFFFRSELQMTSDEGLNAYGAATWGQFFIYQGFNARVGWMHTSTGADVIDEFMETVVERDGRRYYRYGAEERPVVVDTITVPYRTAGGQRATRSFTVYRTHHGPVVREADGKWIAVALMQKPVEALSQSFLRTKARSFDEYIKVAELKANSSNNTVYADADGVIAYLHPQFIPRRDQRFDYTRPVDGSDPATDWRGEHALSEMPSLKNPATGWIQNTNNWPYSAAGAHSPKQADFPRYMDAAGENWRGIHAIMVLQNRRDFTLERLRDAAYDSYQPAFARILPPLIAAFDSTPSGDPLRARVADQIAVLRGWDYRWGAASVPTSVAIYWGEEMNRRGGAEARRVGLPVFDWIATRAPRAALLEGLVAAADRLQADFGTWRTPWGEINRFQRLTGDIVHPFSDAGASIPVPFTTAQWGSLATFGARTYPGTKRRYGTSGNSFVAVVQFGDSVRARAVSAGGESGHPASKHFTDQAARYAAGDLRTVYFYPNQLVGHTERVYRPGERR